MNLIRLKIVLLLLFVSVSAGAQHSILFNGREYLRYPGYINSGIAYFMADTLVKGSLVYDGIELTGVDLIYDQISDDLVTYDFTGKHLVRLVKNKVTNFRIHGSEFIRYNGQYFQVVSTSAGKQLKKDVKSLRETIENNERVITIVTKTELYPFPEIYDAERGADPTRPEGLVNLRVIPEDSLRKNETAYVTGAEAVGSLREGKVSVLEDVVVYGEKLNNVRGSRMGVQKIDIKSIKKIPAVLGEADVLRVVTSLPGVKTVGEASTGLNVRGGSADQNLILLNDATIYNPSHFFGMFSAFNPDLVKDVTLYKSSVPAKYGGRLSSVLEIESKEGSKKEFSGIAGVGPLTSRVTIEGPITKDKTSFLLGARTTYANWLMKLLPEEYENSRANFYDINLVVDHKFSDKDQLMLTAYLSSDRFNLNSDTVFNYRNRNVSLRWNHVFSKRVTGQITAGSDSYAYSIASARNPVNAYRLKFAIDQYYLKAGFNYYLSNDHTIDFGFNTIRYNMQPGSYTPFHENSLVAQKVISREHGLETALYVNDKYDVTNTTTLEAGLRYSIFNFLGPGEVNKYPEGIPKSEQTLVGTEYFGKGKFIQTWGGLEYRASVRQMLGLNTSLKAAFNTQRQYIHMLSNTAAMAPTDIWKLSDPNIKPQQGSQISLGIYQNLRSNTIELSAEVYYKKIKDYLDYKSGANLVLNTAIEADVINTKGKAYGAELLVKKTNGRLNGWISYSWSRILLQQNDTLAGELINEGKYYPANYDKPHDFSLIGNYRINHRFSISLSMAYSTGRPITAPIGRYYYAGSYRALYDKRNERRIPDYFRSDFSLNIDGNHKKHQKTHNSWTVGVYNLTGRKNPYSVYYVSEEGVINGYKLSIFGSAIPFLSYNIKF